MLIMALISAAAGFVAGLLVGRRNKATVDAAVSKAKELEAKVKAG